MLNNQPRALEGQLSPTFEEGKTSLYVKTLRLQGTGISAQPHDCRSLDRRGQVFAAKDARHLID